MTNVLEGLGGVLTTDIEENLLTTSVVLMLAQCPRAICLCGRKAGCFETLGVNPWGSRRRADKGHNVRVLVNEAGGVVDLVVDDDVEVLLGVVLRDVGVGEFLVGHCGVV